MSVERRLYAWSEIGEVPAGTGIYAWYYRHMLTDFDIQKLKSEILLLSGPTKEEEAASLVTDFLQTHLFTPLTEEPYDASMWGALKPRYEGKLHYRQTISASLIQRLATEPDRLDTLKKILAEAVPEFSSPIYIGMSVDLRTRLSRHKSLIEAYKASKCGHSLDTDATLSGEAHADHSFAWDVVRRGLSVNRLEVSVRRITAPESVHVDAENILNRINHPLCGRN